MSALSPFAFRSLAKNKARTIVTIAGVALSAALLTAVLTSVVSAVDFLHDREVNTGGVWHASLYADDEQSVGAVVGAEHVTDSAVVRDAGFAALDEVQQSQWGHYLTLLDVEDPLAWERLCAPDTLAKGNFAAGPGEIVLPLALEGASAFGSERIELGSTVDLSVGWRREVMVDPAERTGTSDGRLSSAFGYFGSVDMLASDQASYEELVDVQPRTYTVVGFYRAGLYAASTPVGYGALVSGDPDAIGAKRLVVRTEGFSSSEDIRDYVIALAPDVRLSALNTALMPYEGISVGRSIWDTLYAIAAVLAVVIVVAGASLIANAFSISIFERMRQFGLLSSVGASRRQIRGAVFIEAALFVIVGAPLGILVGLGGTAAVLAWASPIIESFVYDRAGLDMVVSPTVIAIVVALTVLTVLASALAPALRASKASAIDAIRASEAAASARKMKPRFVRRQQALARAPWKPSGVSVAQRVFGISGAIAHRNTISGRGKGGAAIASLSLAIVLLMTAGVFSSYLSATINATGVSTEFDIRLNAGMSNAGNLDGRAQTAYEELLGIEGAEGRGWYLESFLEADVSRAMAGPALLDAATSSAYGSQEGVREGIDPIRASVNVVVVPDEVFEAFARAVGVSSIALSDSTPIAIASGTVRDNNGTSYVLSQSFAETGDVVLSSRLAPNEATTSENSATVRVVALASELPAIVGAVPLSNTLVMPARFLPAIDMAHDVSLSMSFVADDHTRVADEMEKRASEVFASFNGLSYLSVFDVRESQEQGMLMVTVANVFSLLFSLILTLIAVSNVFNTLSNSLALRRREFAVLRSVGMGDRAFRRMILCECMGYGIKGLVPGVAISLLIAWLLYSAVGMSVEGMPFIFPWSHLGVSLVIVAVVIAISVVFGLRRARAADIVAALRVE